MATFRDRGRDEVNYVKIIWWYIAEVGDGEEGGDGVNRAGDLKGQFFEIGEALEKLYYQSDREAISIAETTRRTA